MTAAAGEVGLGADILEHDSEDDCEEIDWAALQRDKAILGTVRHLGLRRFIDDMLELLHIFNGRWHAGRFEHYCSGGPCCAPTSPEMTREQRCAHRMYDILKRTCFGHAPITPTQNKWTKLAPVVDDLVFGYLLHSVYPKAFAALQVATRPTEDIYNFI